MLQRFIREKGSNGAVIAFSGGVDSSTLAKICFEILGERAVAVSGLSLTYASGELEDARAIARTIGIPHHVVPTREAEREEFASNPENRCYYCKGELLDVLLEFAGNAGLGVVFEGTNASDLSAHRPGFKAITERDRVFSPWVEAGITKDEIRDIARHLGLDIHDKPASPCLASRVPFGERITPDRLKRIERAEAAIATITGIKELRVRDHGTLARIEVNKIDIARLVQDETMAEIVASLKSIGYVYVTVDMTGFRSGSMLEGLRAG